MKKEQDYIQDIAQIRTMMERSSKFLSLSGWAGIMAGVYALAGAFIAYRVLHFSPTGIMAGLEDSHRLQVVLLALVVLTLALSTAIFLSVNKAERDGERLWSPTSKRLLTEMAVPLVSGGVLMLLLIFNGFMGLIAPLSLLFYGLALFNASRYTYGELKIMGLIDISLGLVGCCFIGYGLLLWALGFGLVHIIYGILVHYKYER